MRISAFLLVGILGVAPVWLAGDGDSAEAVAGVRAVLPLPDSLEALYPPVAKQPVYLLKMISLGNSFSGIAVDLMEDDFDGARGSFDEFRRQYIEVRSMAPEWAGQYPEEKVKELDGALAAGEKGLAMEAFAAIGRTCHGCHVAAMVPVQQKYRWGDFAGAVQDPLTGASIGYPQFKQFLSASLAGITVDLKQEQTDNARKQFDGFRARFEALADSCYSCHEQEVRHFVDREIRDTVEEIGKALHSQAVTTEKVIPLVEKIGRESCSKCHLVHLPAAYSRGRTR